MEKCLFVGTISKAVVTYCNVSKGDVLPFKSETLTPDSSGYVRFESDFFGYEYDTWSSHSGTYSDGTPNTDEIYFKVYLNKLDMAMFNGELVDSRKLVEINGTKYLKSDPQVCFYATNSEWVLREDMAETDCVEIDGEFYDEDDDDICLTEEGEWILKDDAFFCDNCETWHNIHNRDYYEVYVGRDESETWCRDCKSNDAFFCEDCNCYYSLRYRDNYYIDGSGYDVCDRCYNNNYYYCEECGHNVRCEDYDSEADCCCECVNDNSRVRRYHFSHGNITKYYKNGCAIEFNRDLKCFGFELEVDDGRSANKVIEAIDDLDTHRLIASYEQDGSLSSHGFETISYPMDIRTFNSSDWETFLNCYKNEGFRSDEASNSCSLHMHFNKTAFFGYTERSVENSVAKLYIFFRKYWNDLVKASRRKYLDWCDLDEDIKECGSELSIIQEQAAYVSKYKKSNNHHTAINQGNPHTIEIRLGKGTLNPKSFRAWVDLMYHVVNNIKRIPFARAHEGALWLSGISNSTKDYLRRRKAFLNIIGECEELMCVAEHDPVISE